MFIISMLKVTDLLDIRERERLNSNFGKRRVE